MDYIIKIICLFSQLRKLTYVTKATNFEQKYENKILFSLDMPFKREAANFVFWHFHYFIVVVVIVVWKGFNQRHFHILTFLWNISLARKQETVTHFFIYLYTSKFIFLFYLIWGLNLLGSVLKNYFWWT